MRPLAPPFQKSFKSITMGNAPRNTGLLFICVVTFCALLVGWWIFFLLRESTYLDRAADLIAEGRVDEVPQSLAPDDGGDLREKAKRLRWMFASEGLFLGLLVVAGVFLLYRSILRENRLRTEQERFLTGATHHLKTPLATVRLGLDSMLAGTMPEEKRVDYLRAMLRETDHLEKDLTNLLTAGGLESSGQGLQLVAGDLAADVRNAADSMRDRFDTAGIILETDIEDGISVQRDREAIHLVLHNLLDNAVKYSAGGDRVSLSLRRNGNSAVLSVQDSGRGIERDEIKRVFDRFYRGSAKGYRGGSGIGLYLVSEIVRSHNGTVSASSEGRGRGATFTVGIPLMGGPE